MGRFPKKQTVLINLRPNERLLMPLLEECKESDWAVIDLANAAGYIPIGRRYIGAIIDSSTAQADLTRLIQLDIPIVLFGDDERDELRDMPRVLLDWKAVGQLAADAFAERGFTDIGLIEFQNEDTPKLKWAMDSNRLNLRNTQGAS